MILEDCHRFDKWVWHIIFDNMIRVIYGCWTLSEIVRLSDVISFRWYSIVCICSFITFSLYINHHALLTFHFFLYCHYPYTYHTISESHFPYIYPVSLKIFIYCILERVWKRLSARCASQFVGDFVRIRAS